MVETPWSASPKTEKMGDFVIDSTQRERVRGEKLLGREKRRGKIRTESLEFAGRGNVDLSNVEVAASDESSGGKETRNAPRNDGNDTEDHQDFCVEEKGKVRKSAHLTMLYMQWRVEREGEQSSLPRKRYMVVGAKS
jgi:hypothetical protein